MAAVRHLGFSKIWFLSTETPWAADFPSWCKIWCKNVARRRNYGPQSKSKMAAVRHLGFVTSSPQSPFIGPHRPVKFYSNTMCGVQTWTSVPSWKACVMAECVRTRSEGSLVLVLLATNSTSANKSVPVCIYTHIHAPLSPLWVH